MTVFDLNIVCLDLVNYHIMVSRVTKAWNTRSNVSPESGRLEVITECVID